MKVRKRDKFSMVLAASAAKIESMPAKLVLIALASHYNMETGVCWPSYTEIADQASCSLRTVTIAINFLKDDLKVITWTPGNSTKANTYEMDLDRIEALSYKLNRTISKHKPSKQMATVNQANDNKSSKQMTAENMSSSAHQLLTVTTNYKLLTRTGPAAENLTDSKLKSKDMNQPSSDVTGSGGPVVFQQEQPESVSYTFKEQRKARFEYMRINGGDPGVWQSLKAEFEPEEKLA